MQAAINALMNLGTAAGSNATGGGAGASGQDGDASAGNQFAQLLSDSGAHAEEQGGQQFSRGQLPQANANGAILAQDIGTPADDKLADILQVQSISVQDAAELVKKIDGMLAHADNKAIIAALTQVKAQLKQIQLENQPKSADEIIAAVPALKDAGIDLQAMVALLQNARKPSVSHDEEVPAQVAAAAQNLAGMMFRPTRRTDAPAPAATGEKKKTSADGDAVDMADVATMVVMQPTAYGAVVPASALAAQDMTAMTTPAVQARPDIDQAIPTLELKPSDSLPYVDLPQTGAAIADEASTQDNVAVGKGNTKATFDQQLSALGAIAPQDVKTFDAVNASDAKDVQSITSLLNTAHTGGHSATQTANAVLPPSHAATPGYVNHAPVTEQVHVAINQAAKDGIDRITIQLDPVDLGRVEVHMQRGHDGQTQISFTVDKPETFDGLSRDARFLERSLQEAGIKADTGSMQFNLRQQPQPQLQSNLDGQGQPKHQANEPDDENTASSAAPIQSVASFTRNYILNIREGVDISA